MSTPDDQTWMNLALRLARNGYGTTSPNPMVGAVLVKNGKPIGRGWHQRAGGPHAEIEAIGAAQAQGHSTAGATLYVTLEPCCTHGRTPPCTEAIQSAGIRRLVAGAVDLNPRHRGRGLSILKRAGLQVVAGVLKDKCERLNEAFNHWIVHRTPFVVVKAAMTLDGKIATASGESKWITGERARAYSMWLRQGADAILVGINTILADNPSLTCRPVMRATRLRVLSPNPAGARTSSCLSNALPDEDEEVMSAIGSRGKPLRRIVLDARARTPLNAAIVTDQHKALTTIVTSRLAPNKRLADLSKHVQVWLAPSQSGKIDLFWLLEKLGAEDVTSLLVEGGGEVNASFLLGGFAHQVRFFYAPKVLCGRRSTKAVAGAGARRLDEGLCLRALQWHKLGEDLLLTARCDR